MEPRASSELRKGFELLDLDGGIGWELLTSMVRYKARQRLSAKAALAHPYFDREGILVLSLMQSLKFQFIRATQQDYSDAASWVIQLMAKSGTEKEGGFTEAQLQELRVCSETCALLLSLPCKTMRGLEFLTISSLLICSLSRKAMNQGERRVHSATVLRRPFGSNVRS